MLKMKTVSVEFGWHWEKTYSCICHGNFGKCYWCIPPRRASECEYKHTSNESDPRNPRLSPFEQSVSFVLLTAPGKVLEIGVLFKVFLAKFNPEER